jgi:uncharacterized membrane protein required for colicin V production
MGLDVALGVVIVIAAIRGWLQGFIYQVIRLGGLIACVYLADPVRDQIKPYVLPHLPSIQPELVDRLFWWVSAGLSYAVIVGVSTLLLKITRRPEIPGIPPQRPRNDQFAGFLLGIAKGALVGAFLVAALQRYALKQIETMPWAEAQAKTSLAIRWDEQYHPAVRIWNSGPVRHFVNHIQYMGLQNPAESPTPGVEDKAEDRPVVKTARGPQADVPGKSPRSAETESAPPAPPAPKPSETQGTDPELEQAVKELKNALDAPAKPK